MHGQDGVPPPAAASGRSRRAEGGSSGSPAHYAMTADAASSMSARIVAPARARSKRDLGQAPHQSLTAAMARQYGRRRRRHHDAAIC